MSTMNATWLYGRPSALHRLTACAFALMMVLPLAIPVLAHHAPMADTPMPAMDHGMHSESRDAPLPCPPLETGLEACCVVDGLPPAAPSTVTAPRVDRTFSLVPISPMTVPSSPSPSPSYARCVPHPWPVPTRIVLSTFLN